MSASGALLIFFVRLEDGGFKPMSEKLKSEFWSPEAAATNPKQNAAIHPSV
jgi:hypothetical protein